MRKLLRILFMNPVLLTVYGVLALAALVWWGGPLIEIGDHRPLDGVWTRLAVLLGLVLVVLAVAGWRSWRRRRAMGAMVQGLQGGPSLADREAQQLAERFGEALKLLEASARRTGRRSLLQRSAYLYDLPWYVFIGAPGSGKTTALMNAGLTFPLAGKMGLGAVKGVGGTRNCDWWFTDQAVLIDTAGRYTLQQSDEAVDASAWQNFLNLLKKARPRRPINGVMLTVNVQDLLQQPPAERKEHAARLRARLQELQQHLGIRPPVYVLVTKLDLIAGFNETFGEFPKESRDQVWGFTWPHDPQASSSAAMQAFGAEFAALEKRLRDRMLDALQTEHDVQKRGAIFSFPQQFGGLKGLLGGFLEQVFEGGGNLEESTLLRGVYFTSGTQEGTPIDRVLGTLARTFGVEGKAPASAASKGKSFFLTRLLRDVVFAEQGLVGENRQAERRRRRLRLGGLALLGVASLGLMGGWAVSLMRNQAHVDEVAARLPELRRAVDTVAPTGGSELGTLPAVLDQVAAAARPSGFETDAVPLLNQLGLYQGRYLQAGADTGYRHLLDHGLMPRVARRLEERLRAVNRDNLELAYEALKGYLMLYTPQQFDPEALRDWVLLDWNTNLAATLNESQREALAEHLSAALANGAPAALAPMDQALVGQVREMLTAYPLEFRIFSRLKRARVASDVPDFSVASAGGPNAAQVFERASGQALTRGVPGLFTREGYFRRFKDAVNKVSAQLEKEDEWVLGRRTASQLGKDAAGQVLTAGNDLNTRVRRLYLQEYIKVWDAYLADVRLVKLGGMDRSLAVARVLAAPDSPLAAYLRAVSNETQLAAAAEAAAKGDKVAGLKDKVVERLRSADELSLLAGEQPQPTGAPAGPIEAMVDQHFAYLHRMVAGKPAPIDDVLKLFNEVYTQLAAVDAAQKSKSPPPPGGGAAAAKAAAGLQPEPIKSMLETLADAGANQSRTAERQGLSAEIKPVADQCARTIAGRFPFAPGAKADVLPDDFGQMFGAGGQLDEFFQRRLATLVDVGTNPWSFKPLPDGSKPPGGAALADFQRAARIKEAFFRAGGKQPGFKVDVRVVEMADGLKELNLDVDGQVFKFSAGNTAAQTLNWPSSKVASQIKLSAAGGGAPQLFEGPWALFRLFNQFEVLPSAQPEKFTVVLTVDGKKARMEVISGSAINPLRMREMAAFRCPDAL